MSMVGGSSGTLVDLFCGCGGFSLGAELAGFRSLAAIDIDGTLQSGYRRNFPSSRAIQASVVDLEGSDWTRLLGGQRPSGVIGGPPCQGFSPIGKRQKDDPRNSLIGQFIRQVNLLKPKFFIMENVQGLLQSENRSILDDALGELAPNYITLEPMVVNAAHFGAATARHRVVVIGFDPNEVDAFGVDLFDRRDSSLVTVRDAISDLPSPIKDAKVEGDFGWAAYPEAEDLSVYAAALRGPPPEGLGSQQAREQHSVGLVSGLVETRHSKAISDRYFSIEGGKSDRTTKSHKLRWDGQCPTLRAGTGSDRGAFQAVRPLHPAEGRVITVREAARLQGFPDWFQFHPTKWHSFRMIGNSVSPFVSRYLLERIAQRMHLALAA
ncbi:DNA cytosine methyltransferase [Caulobacter sp. Root1455]|uniref:DNA cytosine methyltransferase n=1 Tax=Caulobacter sp. Root1455 TaxID=1736465 RepID=UPI0019103018|nr:DNA cytosine methyltransferase [Caulobacter sp. Root1455]